ncbi:MAG: hypothetical protein RSB93_04180 [Rikenellaceae bacterium]
MNSILLTLIIALGVVAFMFVGLAITRIVKGKDLQSDVGNNDHMKDEGIICASKQFRAEEAALSCDKDVPCSSDCGTCNTKIEK